MNSVNVNLHDYCSKLVNLHNYIRTDVGHFKAKLYNFYIFFKLYKTDVNILTICFSERVKGVKFSVSDFSFM